MHTPRTTQWLILGLVGLGIGLRIAGFPFESEDFQRSLVPWYDEVSRAGFSALATDFSNYSPPYLYLLWFAAKLFGPLHPLAAIKSIGVICDLALCSATAMLVTSLVMRAARSTVSFRMVFAIIWCLPTVVVNSAVWGQCDAFYTTFVVAAIAAAIVGNPLTAFGLFGVALSIKLQAMLVAPAIAILLITGRLPWKSVPASVAAFFVMLLPAALAGRSWKDLIGIYANQTELYRSLSLAAPNLWSVVKHIPVIQDEYSLLLAIGLLITAVAGIIYLIVGRKQVLRPSPNAILEIAFVAVFIFPFLLPKMHERYFFLADVLSVALAMMDRRWLLIAVLVQIGSLTSYAPFLLDRTAPLAFGIVADTLVFIAIVMRWLPAARRWLPVAVRDRFQLVMEPL
jgi:Gpi18-like mannosyltransferase